VETRLQTVTIAKSLGIAENTLMVMRLGGINAGESVGIFTEHFFTGGREGRGGVVLERYERIRPVTTKQVDECPNGEPQVLRRRSLER
jgi:hypothetical protein